MNAVLVIGRKRLHIFEGRNYFQDIRIREEGLVIGDELVGDSHHEFFDLTGGVVGGKGRGKRTVAGSFASATTFIGGAEQEEGVLEWVNGEEANKDGGHSIKKSGVKIILNLGFRDILFTIR